MMPLPLGVADSTMISAMGVLDMTSSMVSTPGMIAAVGVPSHSKSIGMAGALKAVVPWNEMTKLCWPLPAMVTGVSAVPVSALVAGLVV